MKNPDFIVFTGPMFGGKTTRLLSTLERYRYQKKVVLAMKPRIDVRYTVGEITTHSGWGQAASTVETGQDILDKIAAREPPLDPPPDVIAVDEAFMIPGCADVLIWLFKQGITIVVSTLDISATGKVFPESRAMLPWATHVEKCPAVCTVCGNDAYYTHRKLEGKNEIQVGGDEMYEPRCFSHHVAIDERNL